MTPPVSVRARPIALTKSPIGLTAPPKVAGTPAKPPKLAAPAVWAMKIAPVSNGGFHVTHHFGPEYHGGVSSPRSFVFSNSDKMFNHVRKTAAVMKPPVKVRIGHSLG